MKILSIETSCDDTALTIMEVKGGIKNASFKILANVSNSQIKIHANYGGVYPMLAKKAHIKNLPILLKKLLKQSKLEKSKKPVDIIAVTYGPGLELSLWSGIVFAKELGELWHVPLIPVNHMEGHILSVFGKNKGKFNLPKLNFPILSLLVSGGHTELVFSNKFFNYEVIGSTLDDAAGEAFDKVARMLDLSYPGGPKISKLAEEVRFQEKGNQVFQGHNFSAKNLFPFSLPRPMIYSKDLNFSFSGLKTAVLYLIRKLGKLNEENKKQIALEFENAVVDVLVYKTLKAQEKYKAKTIIIAGGVACNKHLQRKIKRAVDKKIKLLFPKKGLVGDNGIMIGIAGYLQYKKNKGKIIKMSSIKAIGNLKLK